MGLQVPIRRVGGVTIVDFQGSATLGRDSDSFSGCLRKLIEDGERNVLLNLASLTQLDTSSLSTLARAYVSLRREGGSLKLLRPRGSVKLVLETLHLLGVIPSYEDEAQAVASFSKAASACSIAFGTGDEAVALTVCLVPPVLWRNQRDARLLPFEAIQL
jgi:anti-sigma B factor antagonist